MVLVREVTIVPSSLIFVGLVVAWLLILVPIVARRRQEVARPSEAALACRVLERPGVSRRVQEVSGMDELKPDRQLGEDVAAGADVGSEPVDAPKAEPDVDDEPEPMAGEQLEPATVDGSEEEPDSLAEAVFTPEPEPRAQAALAAPKPGRGYRSGRGGFDPEAAMLAARARYSVRQRVVLALVLAMIATAVAGVVADPILWWVHAAVDLFLVGYLIYLRRQVRIEEEIRQRRAARMAGTRRGRTVAEYVAQREQRDADDTSEDPALPELEPLEPHQQREQDERTRREPEQPALPPLRPKPLPAAPEGTAVIDLDDEDPGLHDLADPGPRGYRRAVGE